MCMQGEVDIKGLSAMDKLTTVQKVGLITLFIKNERLDITTLTDSQSERASCTVSEFIKQTKIDKTNWYCLEELSSYLANMYCNGRDYETYTLIVTQFTKMYIEQFGVYGFKDMSLYYDKPRDKLFGCNGCILLNATIEAINVALSHFEKNMTILSSMLGEMDNHISIKYNIKAGEDEIYATPTAYYHPLIEPIELQHKAKKCIVIVDLSSEYHIVSFCTTRADNLIEGAELNNVQHLYTVDLDTEDITIEFEAFITQIFKYYMSHVGSIFSKGDNNNA